MTVDLMKLKVGDNVRFRGGEIRGVTELNHDPGDGGGRYIIHFNCAIRGKVAQHTAEWTNWCYLENGKWAGDNEYGNHIVEIIDTAPVIRPDTKGYKEATGKIPMQYLPLDLLEGVADILATNCKDNGGKYERDNYRRPIDPTLLIGSLLRHLTQIQTAIRTDDGTYLIDSESKRAHVDHLISNTIMLKAALDNWEDER